MMMYLEASWGFIVMIGGLFAALIILMMLDGPAQRRDALRREDEQRKARQSPSAHALQTSSPQVQGSASKNPGTMTTN